MADDDFRTFRGRDPLDPLRNEDGNDPLAQLARLIGQTDPYAERRRAEPYVPPRSNDDVEAYRQDWAEEDHQAESYDRSDNHYVPPPTLPRATQLLAEAPPHEDYERETTQSGRFFSGGGAQFNGFRDEPAAGYRSDLAPIARGRELPAYAMTEPDEGLAPQELEPEHEGDEAYAADHYYDNHAGVRRRSGIVVVMAIFGLAVIGTAGAFAYRAMFGGSVLPTLPPIIKASNGPNKIMPSYGDAQANNPSQPATAPGTSSENLVSREEQPVTIEPPKPAPRVVSTIPIIGGQAAAPPPVPPGQPAQISWPNPTAPNAGPAPQSPWPANPPGAAVTSLPTRAPAPSAVQAEPKKVHTVVIHSDQSGALETAAPSTPQPAAASTPPARSSSRPAAAASASKPSSGAPRATTGANAPLSIVPGGQNEAPAAAAPRSVAAAAPISVASAGAVTGATAPARSAVGHYAVQVTSQRSEAEAQAAFRELRAKFPQQLGGREPIIRRADLGARGTYYRAMVGPFASMEEAAGMCSGLKAAGASCLVQRE